MNPLITNPPIVKVLQIVRITLQRHGIVLNSLVVHAQPNIAIGPKRITLGTILLHHCYLFAKVLNRLFKPLHLPVNYPNVRIRHCVIRIVLYRLHKVLNRLLESTHVLVTTSSIVVKNGILRIQLYRDSELFAGVLIVLEFVVNYPQGVINGWEFRIVRDKGLEAFKRFFIQ